MRSKSRPPPVHAVQGDLKLAVKDGLRDLRFSMRHGAQALARKLEATSHLLDDFDGPLGRLPRLREPIGAAARTAAHLIESADHAAHALLRPNDDYRQLAFRLQPAARYFAADAPQADVARSFTKAHYWAMRHLLQMRGLGDVVVHEQAVQAAWRRVHDAVAATPPDLLAADTVLQFGVDSDPALLRRADSGASNDDDADALVAYCSAAAVVAGEIAPHCAQADAAAETRTALTLAGEAVAACLPDWQRALKARPALPGLAGLIAFTVRHI